MSESIETGLGDLPFPLSEPAARPECGDYPTMLQSIKAYSKPYQINGSGQWYVDFPKDVLPSGQIIF